MRLGAPRMLLRCCAWAGGKRKVSNGTALAALPRYQIFRKVTKSMKVWVPRKCQCQSGAFHFPFSTKGPYFTYYVKHWYFCSAVLLHYYYYLHIVLLRLLVYKRGKATLLVVLSISLSQQIQKGADTKKPYDVRTVSRDRRDA